MRIPLIGYFPGCHSREGGNPARSFFSKFVVILTLWIPAFAGMTEQAQGQGIEHLRHDLDSLFSDTAFSNATIGVAIQSLKSGEYLYRRTDTKSLTPASNMKLFTTAEALALLGPDYRFPTLLETFGIVTDHTLQGNLIISGSGDPAFGVRSQYFSTSSANILQHWAQMLRRRGIRHISGSIIIDNSYFTPEFYPHGWQLDDAPYYYATPVTALAYDENEVSVNIIPNRRAGKKPTVYFSPGQTRYGIIRNSAITGPPDSPSTIDALRVLGHDTIEITGSVPQGSSEVTEKTSIQNPSHYVRLLFRKALREAGITLSEKQARTLTDLLQRRERFRILATNTSAPLSEIVRKMDKESDNFFAEMLFRDVAKMKGGEGSWERGAVVMDRFLDSLGLDSSLVQFYDGSGLSRMDLVTADDIVTLLRAMASNPKLDSAFYNSLPIMGVDGTLENRLKGTPAQRNVHAKTGSMTGVRSISGYLTTRDGEPIVFSILANNYTCAGNEIGKLEDEVLLRLVNYSRK